MTDKVVELSTQAVRLIWTPGNPYDPPGIQLMVPLYDKDVVNMIFLGIAGEIPKHLLKDK